MGSGDYFGSPVHGPCPEVEDIHCPGGRAAVALTRIETERELEVYADGDFACKTPVEIGVIRRALRVIAPV